MKNIKDYLQFPEPIVKIEVMEIFNKKGCKLEYLIVNDKWKMTPTGNPEKPFRKRRCAKYDI